MAAEKGFKQLKVWHSSFNLCLQIYKLTKAFPDNEMFGLTSQLRRSSISVPSNIAEGYGRQSTGSFLNFTKIALGSLNEVETQVLLAQDLGYISKDQIEQVNPQIVETRRMLLGLIRKLSIESRNKRVS